MKFIFLKPWFALFIAMSLCFPVLQAQKAGVNAQSNSTLPFEEFLKGVKYAEILLSPAHQQFVDSRTDLAPFYYLAKEYLLSMGFQKVALTTAEKSEMALTLKSFCDVASVGFSGDIGKKSISNLNILFLSCQDHLYQFSSTSNFTYHRLKDIEQKLLADWRTICFSPLKYEGSKRLSLPSAPTSWTEEKIRAEFANRTPDRIEGIYERVWLSDEDYAGGKLTLAVIKASKPAEYLVIYLKGASNSLDWKHGELKGRIKQTATPNTWAAEWILREKSLTPDAIGYLNDKNILSILSTGIYSFRYDFLKLYPSGD